MIVCGKVRDGDRRTVVIKDGADLLSTPPPGGVESETRTVLIVDDLVQSGGTLVECARQLRATAHPKVKLRLWCFVTHPVFPNDSWRRFLPGGDAHGVFDRFYTTDSRPKVAELLQAPPADDLFVVIPLMPLANALL
jgi:phosphoribosylpyrophosphate synthetase